MASRGCGDRPSKTKRDEIRKIVTTSCALLLGICIGCVLATLGTSNSSQSTGDRASVSANSDHSELLPNCDHDLNSPSEASLGIDSPLRPLNRPRGTEGLPPAIIVPETDLYQRRLWGNPAEDLPESPSKYLVTFTVGVQQKVSVNLAVAKFPKEWTIMLFHYDGEVDEWGEFAWSQTAIHVSAQKQTKWWYAKRFLHPDVVAPFDYIFLWDEDLGVEHFDAEEYIALVRKHGLEISQPGLNPASSPAWEMTRRKAEGEVHMTTLERPGYCNDPHQPPCAAFVEIMAPVFSAKAWRCVWHMIQNDLVHGWGLDFAMRRCVEPAYQKMGVVDSQWIEHQGVPSLGQQGEAVEGLQPWEAVRQRCNFEWQSFAYRIDTADKLEETRRNTLSG